MAHHFEPAAKIDSGQAQPMWTSVANTSCKSNPVPVDLASLSGFTPCEAQADAQTVGYHQQFMFQQEQLISQLFEDLAVRLENTLARQMKVQFAHVLSHLAPTSQQSPPQPQCSQCPPQTECQVEAQYVKKVLAQNENVQPNIEIMQNEINALLELERDLRFEDCYDIGPKNHCAFLQAILQGRTYERLYLLMTVVYAVFMVITVSHDIQIQHSGEELVVLNVLLTTLSILFFTETGAKLVAFRLKFFTGPDKFTNMSEFFCVIWSIIQAGSLFIYGTLFMADLPIVVMLRLLRFARVISLRAMPFTRELHTMMYCILGSLKTLFWCMVMLTLLTVSLSIVFMQGTAQYLRSSTDPDTSALLKEHWGTLPRSMTTLFAAVTGGQDWLEYEEPLSKVGVFYLLLFYAYISLFLVCVTNVVMAHYIESAFNCRQKDNELNLMVEFESLLDCEKDFTRMYHVLQSKLSRDPSKIISRAEFVERMRSPVLKAYFAVMGLKIWDSNDFFDRLLTTNCKPEESDLDLSTFVEGCTKLRAPGMDLGMYTSLNELRKGHKYLSEQIQDLRVTLLRGHSSENECDGQIYWDDIDSEHDHFPIPPPLPLCATAPVVF